MSTAGYLKVSIVRDENNQFHWEAKHGNQVLARGADHRRYSLALKSLDKFINTIKTNKFTIRHRESLGLLTTETTS